MIVNGSDQKGPWLLMGQACPSYGLKPCSEPILLPAGPAAALASLTSLFGTSSQKRQRKPPGLEGANTRETAPSKKGEVSSQQKLPFNKERKPPMFWGKMQVNLPPSMFGFQYQGKKKEGKTLSSSMGIKHLIL